MSMLLGPPKLDFHQKRPSPFKFNTIFSPAIRNDLSKSQRVELTHFQLMLHFYTPWKQKTWGFLMFSGCIEVEYWLKMGQLKLLTFVWKILEIWHFHLLQWAEIYIFALIDRYRKKNYSRLFRLNSLPKSYQ